MHTRLFFFLVLFSPLLAQGSAPSDPTHIQTFKGQIVSVQRYNLVTRPAPHVQFIFKADGKEYTVEAGPEWYVHSQGIILVPREEIEVQGTLSTEGPMKVIVASSLKQGGNEIKLRDSAGRPLWGSGF